MIHRPPASRGRRALVPRKRSPSLTLVAALATVSTLVLGVVTVSTISGESGAPAVARDGGQPTGGQPTGGQRTGGSPPVTRTGSAGTGGHQGNPGAAGSGSVASSQAGNAGSPRGGPYKVLKLGDHPLLTDPGAGLTPAGCDLPRWDDTLAAAKDFFTSARECLDEAWAPALRRHDLPFRPPELHFPTGTSFRTECGTIQIGVATAAYYCENDLYVPFAGLQTEQYGHSPGIYLALFAHEYGHHVQELSGIMDAAWQEIYRAGRTSPGGLEMARRKELQAQCFSGMFLATRVGRGGDITQRMFASAWTDQASRGDDNAGTRNHGSNAHYAKWWRTGARTNNLAACNTFVAPGSAVS